MADSTESSGPVQDGINVDVAVLAECGVALLVADFDDLDAAWDAYDLLKSAADGKRLSIEGVIVFKKLDHGSVEVQKVTDRQTKRGLKWGIVGGIALGVLFPPSILGSAAVLGATGAGIGRLRHLHNSSDMAAELGKGVEVGHSGLIALVSDPVEVELQQAFARANHIVTTAIDKATAEDIRQEAEVQEQSAPQADDE
ncbi:MAG: DUF1269 domain-containing protein [Actinobacteria bacterium]|nr:DUF1269 domain-containing protein [Actinomycetota bacterium]